MQNINDRIKIKGINEMKIQLPDKCPVCGAEMMATDCTYVFYKCNFGLNTINPNNSVGNCADKILIKFGTADTTGYEEKQQNENNS